MEQLNERNSELELRSKLVEAELEKERDQLRSQLESAESGKQRALEQSKSLDSQKLKLLEEAEARHKDLVT